MSDDDESPAVNYNGDTNHAVNFNGVANKNNMSSPNSPPTEVKPSQSQSPPRTRSPSPSRPSTQPVPPPPPPIRTPPAFPAREDCWTEAATHTLVEAWGSHLIELNRGNLRQKHWQEVADAVNELHAHTKKQHRTDIQCKNRIDTLKKKFKVEKNQTLQSNGRYVSSWPFFNGLDALIGNNYAKNSLSVSPSPIFTPARAAASTQYRKSSPAPPVLTWKSSPMLLPPPSAIPVAPRSKRPVSEEVFSRRNFSAMAAAAARANEEEDEADDADEDDEESETPEATVGGCGQRTMADGFQSLAAAVGRFAEVYERVEEAKQRQIVELEKQRMQFAKDLEIQRMKLFMETQVQLEKLKRVKRNSPNEQSQKWHKTGIKHEWGV